MQLPARLRKRTVDTHKGDYGYVLALGGSTGLTGALCLCAQAALRAGAGAVIAGVPASLHDIFETKLTEVMTLPLDEGERGCLGLSAFSKIDEIKQDIDVLAIGCGASRKGYVRDLIWRTVAQMDKPMVIDADGLNAFIGNLDKLKERKSARLVLTPHLGEFSRLTGRPAAQIKRGRKKLVKDFAFRYNLTLVLKGADTLVSDGKKVFQNTSGNPGMATAGSGDVLTGVIAGLMAQGLSAFDAAKYGVYWHGAAGDCAAKDKTQVCLLASDIIEYLPKAVKVQRRQPC